LDVWILDIEDEIWKDVHIDGEDKPAARGWFDAEVVDDNMHSSIVVHEGLGESNKRLDDLWMLQIWMFSPATLYYVGHWKETCSAGASCVLL
jgi:hypothetical protein